MDPRPTNYLRQNIVFSYSEMTRVSFSLFLSLSVFCYVTLLLIFMKIILLLLLIFFIKIIFICSCSGIFLDVPAGETRTKTRVWNGDAEYTNQDWLTNVFIKNVLQETDGELTSV